MPPAAPRPSLQLPLLLSLDNRSVVDNRGKYCLREIWAPPSPSSSLDDRCSPSVIVRLMGLDAFPHEQEGDGEGGGHAVTVVREVRKSERVPQWFMLRFRFVDPAFFERPVSTQLWDQRLPPVATTETTVWRVPDLAAIGPMGATSRGAPLGSMRARFSRNPPPPTAGRSRCTARWRWRDHAVR
jgi:hypothetical protein